MFVKLRDSSLKKKQKEMKENGKMGWGKIFMWKCTNTYGERGENT